MSLEEYVKEKLWPVFVEAVHSLVMFHNHKTYTRDRILPEKPEITPMELASRLNVSLGEALVILYELKEESKSTP
jgi:ribosomal protein S25